MRGAISRDEWLCMARALEAIDREFSEICQSRSVPHAEVAEEQRRRYASCLDPLRPEVIECGILSTEPECLEEIIPQVSAGSEDSKI